MFYTLADATGNTAPREKDNKEAKYFLGKICVLRSEARELPKAVMTEAELKQSQILAKKTSLESKTKEKEMGNILETFKPDMHAQNQAAKNLIDGINKQSENNNNTLNAMLAIFENSRRDAREREKNDIEYNKNLNDSWQQGAFQKMLMLKDEKNPDGTPKYTDRQVMELLDKDKQAYIESQGGYRSGKHADLAETIAGGVAMGAKKLWDMGKGLFTKNEQDSQAGAQNVESSASAQSAPQDSQQNAQNALTSGIQGSSTQGSPLAHLEKESMASQAQSALRQGAPNQVQELNRRVSETLAMVNPSQPQSISEGKAYQYLDTSSLKNTNAKN